MSLIICPFSPSPECHVMLKFISPLMLGPAGQARSGACASSDPTPPTEGPAVSVSPRTHDRHELEVNLRAVAVRECISISHPAPSLVSSLLPSKFTSLVATRGCDAGASTWGCIFSVLYSHSHGWAMIETNQREWMPFPQNNNFNRS
jgi:hypothetical protein